MPYIKQKDRERIDKQLNILNAGELNYLITKLIGGYIAQERLSYSTLNEVVGVLECAKLELYRRMVAPYEDEKIIENGDVY